MPKPNFTQGLNDAQLLISALFVYTTSELDFKFKPKNHIKNSNDGIEVYAEITELVNLINTYLSSNNLLLIEEQKFKEQFNQFESKQQEKIKNAITCLNTLQLIKSRPLENKYQAKRKFLLPIKSLLSGASERQNILNELKKQWNTNLIKYKKYGTLVDIEIQLAETKIELAEFALTVAENDFPQEIYAYTKNRIQNVTPFIPKLKSIVGNYNKVLSQKSWKILLSLIRFFIATGKLNEAQKLLLLSNEYLPKSKKSELAIAQYQHYLGVIYFQQGQYQLAKDCFNQEYDIRSKIFDDDDLELADTIHSQGGVYLAIKQYAEAQNCFLRAIAIRKQHFSPDQQILIVNSLNGLGDALYEQQKFKEAEQTYNIAIELTEKIHKNHQFLAYSKMGIAKIKIKENQYQIAAELYQQAIIILTEIYSNESSELAQPKAALGEIYLRCGHIEKGKQFYQEAIDLLKHNFGNEYYLIGLYQNDLLAWNKKVRSRDTRPLRTGLKPYYELRSIK